MNPTINAYEMRRMDRPWGEEIVIAEGPGYVGKILLYDAACAGGLQKHERRTESFHMFSGEAWVDSDDGHGDLIRQKMTAGMTFTIPAGAAHRFTAITPCIVFEVSDSAVEDRVRLEAQYGEPETGGLPTTGQRGH